MATDSVVNAIPNPYVGPRTFTEQERDLFFGRNREARDLFSLVLSERLVLFYAQSGAGKSSLINTRLLPMLREASFITLPIGRVSGSPLLSSSAVTNIYVFNLLLRLDQDRQDPASLAEITLTDYLRQTRPQPTPEAEATAPVRVLIIDQFEEILTTNVEHWQKREDFFRQLAQAIQDDPLLWVVLSMREDYVAPLDPYARFLPGKLRTRFYMQRLSRNAALEAVEQPAAKGGRPFAAGVAERLVNNLAEIRVSGQATASHLGEFVEPVQLQVVCYQLWENLKGQPVAEITEEDLARLGDVDTALAQFYEQVIAQTIQQTGISEIDLRDWFQTQLITEAGTRGLVYRGQTLTGSLPNRAVDFLAGKYLLRSEIRTGGIWYELVHDRFIEPILQANQAWRLKQPLIQIVQAWVEAGRSPGLLLAGQPLQEVLTTNWQGLGPLVGEFVAASQAAQQAQEAAQEAVLEAQRQRELEQAQALAQAQKLYAEEQANAAARLRQRNLWLTVFGAVAVVLMVMAIAFGFEAQQRRQDAESAQGTAVTERQTAVSASTAAAVNAAEYRKLLDSQPTAAAIPPETPAVESMKTVAAAGLEDQASALQAALTAVAPPVGYEETTTAETEATSTAAADTPPATLEIVLATAELVETASVVVPTAESQDTPDTPTPTPNPTATPSPTETPTPNLIATATIIALQRQLTEVNATQTAIAGLQDPPFPLGQVVSFGGATSDFLLLDPFNQQTGIARVPVGTPALLLAQGPGDTSYGSGIWYQVEVTGLNGSDRRLVGWLPMEVVEPLDASQVAAPCRTEAQGEFRSLWQQYQERLGCPIQTEPVGGFYAEQPFEHGMMYWSQIIDLYIVRIAEPANEWHLIYADEVGSYNPDGPSCLPPLPPPPDKFLPIRGFSAIWCDRAEIQEALGWGIDREKGVSGDALQQFDQGLILRDSNGVIFVFFTADGTYVRVN